MKQAIAILDATGEDGMLIARALAPDYRLLLFGHESTHLEQIADEIKRLHPYAELDFPGCAFEASWEADAIIMNTVDAKAMAEKIREVATQKLVIELTDTINESGLQPLLPNSKIRQVDNEDAARMLENIRKILDSTK